MCAKGFTSRFPLHKLHKKSTQRNEILGQLQKMRQQKMPKGKHGRGR